MALPHGEVHRVLPAAGPHFKILSMVSRRIGVAAQYERRRFETSCLRFTQSRHESRSPVVESDACLAFP